MRSTRRPLRLALGLLVLVCAGAGADARQLGSEAPPATAVSEPFDVPSLGLSLLLPPDAKASVRSGAGKTTAQIQPADDTWLMQVFNLTSSKRTLTIDDVLDSIVAQRRAAQEQTPQLVVEFFGRMGPDELTIAGTGAGRFYCHLPGEKDQWTTGYTVFQTGPGQFIVMQLSCSGELFRDARNAYETIIASAEFRDMTEVHAEQHAALLAGSRFLEGVTREDIEAVLDDEPAFFRVYKPATTGATDDAEEIAWRRVQLRLGQLGEVNPEKPQHEWTREDREFGYLARVDALAEQDGITYESRAIYFLSRDRSRETCSIWNTITNGELDNHFNTTIIRNGRRMTVKTMQKGQGVDVREDMLPEVGYISKFELEVLPLLVARKALQDSPATFDFAFYDYNLAHESLTTRRDRFSNIDIRGWTYETIPARRDEEVRAVLDEQGRLRRRDMPTGQVIEPIEYDRLVRLWRGTKVRR